MSLECSECERDLRGGHDPSCSRYVKANAEPDEPIFTLRASDPIAPSLVRIWRYLRAGELERAKAELLRAAHRLRKANKKTLLLTDKKSIEAEDIAQSMEDWRREQQTP